MLEIKYLNLTAGLYFFEQNFDKLDLNEFRITHLQSSHIETKAFDAFLNDVPHDILFNLAIGNKIIIYDATSNGHSGSKMLRIGIPLLIYFLKKLYFGIKDVSYLKSKGIDIVGANKVYKFLDKKTKKRIRYYKPYTLLNKEKEIRLEGIGLNLKKEDGKYIINEFINNFKK